MCNSVKMCVQEETESMRGLCDIHCHVIPGVDDGATDFEEALEMLKWEYREGIRTIIATPHFRTDMFETSRKIVAQRFNELRQRAKEEKCGIELYLGCEFHSNMDMVKYLNQNPAYTMAGSKYVLVEFSAGDEKRYIQERLYSVLCNGYRPIIAHIERYNCVRKNIDLTEELIRMGAQVQVNAGSILGEMGFLTKRFTKRLLKEQLVHYIGSDAHGALYRRSRMNEAYYYITKIAGERYANLIFYENPKRIIK